jgi:hypothetical protein
MMYMPDAVRAMIELMETDGARLRYRNAYNVTIACGPRRMATLKVGAATVDWHFMAGLARRIISMK